MHIFATVALPEYLAIMGLILFGCALGAVLFYLALCATILRRAWFTF